tara:strand:- start:835 stop:1047 length:213 start_codon:yes stop_codon:yes gene_type:complete
MQSIVLFFLVIGIVMIAIGYQRQLNKATTKTVVEYRYIPRSIYEEQIAPVNLQQSFTSMFDKEDVFMERI